MPLLFFKIITMNKKYIKVTKMLPEIVRQKGSGFLIKIIEEKKPEIQKYVFDGGNKPSNNLFELATQAALTHENEIAKEMQQSNTDYDTAESLIFSKQSFDGVENFAPALLAVVGAIGKTGITAINESRIKQGKKPILSGPFWQQFKKKTAGVEIGTDGDRLLIGIDGKPPSPATTAAGRALEAMQAEIESQAKKDYLRKTLPIFLVVVAAIVLFVIYIRKK